MINDQLQAFLKDWTGKEPSTKLALDYLPLARELMFADEELVRKVIALLVSNIKTWAKWYSPVYGKQREIFEKEHLKGDWHVPFMLAESAQMATSGTTTGRPFPYLRWNSILHTVEGTNHYDMILDEFGIGEEPNILYLLFNHNYSYGIHDIINVRKPSTDLIENHGISRRATVHCVAKTQMYNTAPDSFYEYILDYLDKNPMDVILSSGPYLNSLSYHATRLKFQKRIAKLISNTNEAALPADTDFFIRYGLADYFCDHMRCWDGGAGFFTCKHGTYHLMDNLSYCKEDQRRLICTDYFSFPSPFVNYWNGDYAAIEETYKRCDCGRLYRPFEFMKSRPFSLKGQVINEFEEKLKPLGVISKIRAKREKLEVVTDRNLTEIEKDVAKNVMKGFNVTFTTEARPSSFGPMIFTFDKNDCYCWDYFNATDGTSLASHGMDNGSGWTVVNGTWTINSNKLGDTGLDAENYVVTEGSHSEALVQATVRFAVATASPGIIGRYSDANNYWLMAADVSNSRIYLFKRVAGSFTAVANVAQSYGTGVDYDFTMTFCGDAIKCEINGGQVISIVDSFNNTATKYGIRDYINSSGDESTFDTFVVCPPDACPGCCSGLTLSTDDITATFLPHTGCSGFSGSITLPCTNQSGTYYEFMGTGTLSCLTGAGSSGVTVALYIDTSAAACYGWIDANIGDGPGSFCCLIVNSCDPLQLTDVCEGRFGYGQDISLCSNCGNYPDCYDIIFTQ